MDAQQELTNIIASAGKIELLLIIAAIQDDIETLRKRILEMLDRLSDADCAEVYATLKERGVL